MGHFFSRKDFWKQKTDGYVFTPTQNKCYTFMEESGVPIDMSRLMSDRSTLSFTVPNCCFIHFQVFITFVVSLFTPKK